MSGDIVPSAAALREAAGLSEELVRGIELSQFSLTSAALRAARLARLLNDFSHEELFRYEASGYPSEAAGVPPKVWAVAERAGRVYEKKVKDEVNRYAKLESIEQLEAQIEAAKIGLDAARDASISVSNPNQYVSTHANGMERLRLHNELKDAVKHLGARRTFIYSYALQKNLELRFSGIAGDAFSRIRELVDGQVGSLVPSAIAKFNAIYENLQSENPEDWSNAVHSCRRVLQDLADALYPPSDKPVERGGKKISLGPDQYINRLICFAEDQAKSERTEAIIGSQLHYLGERLDALFRAAQKGSHSVISSRDEADRYVVYTYMIVGDLLRLKASV